MGEKRKSKKFEKNQKKSIIPIDKIIKSVKIEA